MIVDYDYYKDVFKGTTSAFDASTFEDVEHNAEYKLNYLTSGRLACMDTYSDKIKDAICALCDALHDIDTVRTSIRENNGNVVSSMSSFGISVSYASDVTELRRAAVSLAGENCYLRKIASEYLIGSGLMYVGF